MKIEELTAEQQAQQAALEESARGMARALDGALNPHYNPSAGHDRRENGFALLLFKFGDPPQPATYISNGPREDMIRTVEEWLARVKAS